MVQMGTFREDLYYRLNVAAIKVPPLRERKQDIPLLIDHIIRKINSELSKRIRKVEGAALKRMTEYEWPGNVRELENVLTHGAINSHGEIILEELIAPLLGKKPVSPEKPKGSTYKSQNLKDLEKDYIVDILNRTHWHLGKACVLLGISRPTLRHKLKLYGLYENIIKS
jgi:DNA-binding NtrC family response regulator